MQQPPPVTVRSRPAFQLFIWTITLLTFGFALGLLLRALSWVQLIPQEPTLLGLFLPVGLLFAITLWLGRWALFHSTVRITIDEEGLAMRSGVASDSLRWEEVEVIRLQATSGSEAQLLGNGHRVTLPSGSAPAPEIQERVQAWITYKLNHRELEFGDVHFWGP